MAKEWILNSAMNRFQFNFSRNVGKVSEEIRKCTPKNLEDWKNYYFANVKTQDHLVELGKRLYVKITEVIAAEIDDITENDCILYLQDVVINRTFDGYMTEVKTIYGQLEQILECKISPASDKWDRLYSVDFFIEIKEKFIGIQIKPVSNVSHIPQIYNEHAFQLESHKKFTKEFGGKVFYIYSIKDGTVKKIHNYEVIDEIREEIRRLSE